MLKICITVLVVLSISQSMTFQNFPNKFSAQADRRITIKTGRDSVDENESYKKPNGAKVHKNSYVKWDRNGDFEKKNDESKSSYETTQKNGVDSHASDSSSTSVSESFHKNQSESSQNKATNDSELEEHNSVHKSINKAAHQLKNFSEKVAKEQMAQQTNSKSMMSEKKKDEHIERLEDQELKNFTEKVAKEQKAQQTNQQSMILEERENARIKRLQNREMSRTSRLKSREALRAQQAKKKTNKTVNSADNQGSKPGKYNQTSKSNGKNDSGEINQLKKKMNDLKEELSKKQHQLEDSRNDLSHLRRNNREQQRTSHNIKQKIDKVEHDYKKISDKITKSVVASKSSIAQIAKSPPVKTPELKKSTKHKESLDSIMKVETKVSSHSKKQVNEADAVDLFSSSIDPALTDPIHAIPQVTYDANYQPLGDSNIEGMQNRKHWQDLDAPHSYLRKTGPIFPHKSNVIGKIVEGCHKTINECIQHCRINFSYKRVESVNLNGTTQSAYYTANQHGVFQLTNGETYIDNMVKVQECSVSCLSSPSCIHDINYLHHNFRNICEHLMDMCVSKVNCGGYNNFTCMSNCTGDLCYPEYRFVQDIKDFKRQVISKVKMAKKLQKYHRYKDKRLKLRKTAIDRQKARQQKVIHNKPQKIATRVQHANEVENKYTTKASKNLHNQYQKDIQYIKNNMHNTYKGLQNDVKYLNGQQWVVLKKRAQNQTKLPVGARQSASKKIINDGKYEKKSQIHAEKAVYKTKIAEGRLKERQEQALGGTPFEHKQASERYHSLQTMLKQHLNMELNNIKAEYYEFEKEIDASLRQAKILAEPSSEKIEGFNDSEEAPGTVALAESLNPKVTMKAQKKKDSVKMNNIQNLVNQSQSQTNLDLPADMTEMVDNAQMDAHLKMGFAQSEGSSKWIPVDNTALNAVTMLDAHQNMGMPMNELAQSNAGPAKATTTPSATGGDANSSVNQSQYPLTSGVNMNKYDLSSHQVQKVNSNIKYSEMGNEPLNIPKKALAQDSLDLPVDMTELEDNAQMDAHWKMGFAQTEDLPDTAPKVFPPATPANANNPMTNGVNMNADRDNEVAKADIAKNNPTGAEGLNYRTWLPEQSSA